MSNLIPKNAISDLEIKRCFDVMSELRTDLVRDQFLGVVRDLEQQGYQLAYLEEDEIIVSVAGYRITKNLFLGKHLYIDDLVTSQKARSIGYGHILYIWLRDQALNAGCSCIHLDSAVNREKAHGFYFRQGLKISSFHFRDNLH